MTTGAQVPSGLPFREVLRLTLERHPQHSLLGAVGQEAQARRRHAQSLLPDPPALSLRTQNDALGSGRGEREWETSLELPVWLPGQRAARKALAQAAALGSAAGREALNLQVAGLLRELIWDVQTETANVELAQLRHRTAQGLHRDVERRCKAGELARTDVMLAQNEALQAEAQLVRAEATLAQAKGRYTLLTGLGVLPTGVEEVPSAIRQVDPAHPLLKEADAKVARVQQEREIARVERRENPQIQLWARTQRGGFDYAFNKSVGIGLRIPFAAPGRSSVVIASAELEVSRAKAERNQVKYTLTLALDEARLNVETVRQEAALAERQQENARETQRLAQKAFDLGEADLVQLMRAQALGYEAARAHSLKKIQLQREIARFNQSAGVTP